MADRPPEQPPRGGITSGEIAAGLVWIAFFAVLFASGWGRGALTVIAARAPSGLF